MRALFIIVSMAALCGGCATFHEGSPEGYEGYATSHHERFVKVTNKDTTYSLDVQANAKVALAARDIRPGETKEIAIRNTMGGEEFTLTFILFDSAPGGGKKAVRRYGFPFIVTEDRSIRTMEVVIDATDAWLIYRGQPVRIEDLRHRESYRPWRNHDYWLPCDGTIDNEIGLIIVPYPSDRYEGYGRYGHDKWW